MKSLIRWSATLSLVGSTALGALLGFNMPAQALPDEQIIQKLQAVPVFTVADAEGAPLVASGENQERVAGVFISQSDAQAFVARLRQNNPELARQVQVYPVSLGEIYQLDRANEAQTNGLDFAFVPMQDEVELAQTLLNQQGQQYQGGVPLFVAKGGDGGYLTIEREGRQMIPFFFEKAQLQQMVDRFKQQQPNLASTVQLEVLPLEGVIATMQQRNDQQLSNIVLVPSRESIQFIQSRQNQNR